jgi:hypothetical protein
MQTVTARLPVSRRTLYVRLSRHLEQRGQRLRTARGDRATAGVGRYYIVDLASGTIVHAHVDLEAFARDHGVLRPYETITE